MVAHVAGAAGDIERDDDPVARLHAGHVGTDFLNDAHGLMAEDVAGVEERSEDLVQVQVGAAQAGGGDLHDHVGGVFDHGVGHGIHAHVALTVPGQGLHGDSSIRGRRAHRVSGSGPQCPLLSGDPVPVRLPRRDGFSEEPSSSADEAVPMVCRGRHQNREPRRKTPPLPAEARPFIRGASGGTGRREAASGRSCGQPSLLGVSCAHRVTTRSRLPSARRNCRWVRASFPAPEGGRWTPGLARRLRGPPALRARSGTGIRLRGGADRSP